MLDRRYTLEMRLARLSISALLGMSLATSLTTRLFVEDLSSWTSGLVALGVLTTVGIYWALEGWIPIFMNLPKRILGIFIALSLAFSSLYIALRSDPAVQLVWMKDAGKFSGQELATSAREAWGKRYSAFEIHATTEGDPQWMWRASVRLPKDIQAFGGAVTLLVTQPEWSVFDKAGRVYRSNDGVDVRCLIERNGHIESVCRLRLDLVKHPTQRFWQRVKVAIPLGSESLELEALPGPPGSNNWNDRVFIGAEKIVNSAESVKAFSDWVLFVVAIFLWGLAFNAVTPRLPSWLASRVLLRMILCSGVLSLFLLGVRLSAVSHEFEKDGFAPVSSLLLSAYNDFVYVGILTGLFVIVLYGLQKNLKAQGVLYKLYVLIASISISMSILNAEFSRFLGGPLNYQWLYYSDFLSGQTARSSLVGYVHTSWRMLALIGISNVAFLGLLSLMKRRVIYRIQQTPEQFLSIAATIFVGVYFLSFVSPDRPPSYKALTLVNPVISFVKSLSGSETAPKLFTMQTSSGFEDFQPSVEHLQNTSLPAKSTHSDIRNVILFVMESAGAKYVYEKNGAFETIAEIKKYQQEAATFTNIYAHVPASNQSLVSILCGVYPLISYISLTKENPSVELPCIAGALKQRGYRTAFFSSGDFRFQRGDEFLSHQRFDIVASYKDIRCNGIEFKNSTKDWPFQNSFDDECMLAAFTRWAAKRENRPFFGVLWPVQMHHPYSVIGTEINFGVGSEDFNRYLNTLRRTDLIFGRLMEWLASEGLLDSTLVVVMGDHGEAFGQHGQWVHASSIYEENIHIPFILVNRQLFNGERYSTIGGLVDVAPTLMDILRIPPEPSWQGTSLFNSHRSGRTYFFTPYSRFLFGLREGNLKLIMDGVSNEAEVYDLRNDPNEKTNLATRMPRFISQSQQRIATWVQYETKFYRQVLRPKSKALHVMEERIESPMN